MSGAQEPQHGLEPSRDRRVARPGTATVFLALAVAAATAILFIPFPDSDVRILGIRWHRFFLTHSAIVPLLVHLAAAWRRLGRTARLVLRSVAAGSAVTIGIHLVTDIIPKQTIKFPLIGNLWYGSYLDDRIWIVGHAAVCFWLVWRSVRWFRSEASQSWRT